MLPLMLACATPTPTPDTGVPAHQDTQIEADLTTLYRDADGDGFGDPDWPRGSDVDALDGWSLDATDCDDTDATAFPGAPEVSADGIDQDCDGRDPCTGPRRWHVGDVTLYGQDQWEAFCTAFDAVDGDLTVASDALDPWVGCLCEVSGSVEVSDTTDIAGLRGVTAIGGSLHASYPHDLRSLQTVGRMTIWADRVSAPRLQTVADDLGVNGRDARRVLDLPSLTQVGGDLYLNSVAGELPALTHASSVSVRDSSVSIPLLTHTDAVTMSRDVTLDLPELTSTGALSYEAARAELVAPALWSVDWLNARYAPVGSLPSLTRIGLLLGIQGLPDLPALVHLDALWWQGSVDDLASGAPALRRIQDATLHGTVDLDQVPPAWRIDQLTLSSARLQGRLTDPAVIDGTLVVSQHNEGSLAALGNVTSIPGGLRIVNSRFLETLALDGLAHIGGGLLITGNTALPQHEIDALLDQVTVDGNVVVE